MSSKILGTEKIWEKSDNYNLISMGDTDKGIYSITNLEEFWKSYCENYKSIQYCLGQPSHQEYCPFIIDVDLEEKYELEDKLYSYDKIKKFTIELNSIVKNNYEGISNNNLYWCLLEKEPYYDSSKGRWKNGFHLHNPYLFVSRESLKLIYQNEKLNAIYKLDDVSNKMWLLYGSSKKENLQPYLLTKIFCEQKNQIGSVKKENWFKNYNLFDFKGNKIKITETNLDYYLPRIFSMTVDNRDDYVKEQKYKPITITIISDNDISTDRHEMNKCESLPNIDIVQKIIDNIDIEYATTFNHWWKIGCAIFNMGLDNDVAYELFDRFSRKCLEKYSEIGVRNTWNGYKEYEIGFGTLCYYSKLSNQEKHKEIFKEYLFNKNKDKIKIKYENYTELDTATMFYDIYAKEYVKYNIDEKHYWRWNNDKLIWEKNREYNCLMINLKDYIQPILDSIKNEYKIEDEEVEIDKDNMSKNEIKKIKEDNKKRKEDNKKIKAVYKAIKKYEEKLGSPTYWRKAWDALIPQIIDRDFDNLLNKSADEIPISNQIYNLKTGEIRMRTTNDYFNFSLDFTIIENCDFTNVKRYMESVFVDKDKKPNQELIDFIQVLLGYFLTGNTNHRKFYMFYGSGCNSKSTFVNLIKKVCGKFYGDANQYLFILPKSSSKFNAELSVLRNHRVVAVEEVDKNERLNSKNLKNMTGNNTIVYEGKGLNELIKFETQSKGIICNNTKPEMDSSDQAIIDRLCIIPFNNRFFLNDKSSREREEKIRSKLEEQYPDYERCEIDEMVKNRMEQVLKHQKLYTDEELEVLKQEGDEFQKIINSKEFLNQLFNWIVIGAKKSYEVIHKDTPLPKLCKDELKSYVKNNDLLQNFLDDSQDYSFIDNDEWNKKWDECKNDNERKELFVRHTDFKVRVSDWKKQEGTGNINGKELDDLINKKFGDYKTDRNKFKFVRNVIKKKYNEETF